jgi:hypothetical protein
MFQTQRRSLVFMLAGLAVVGVIAGFASGADPTSAGLLSYDVTLTPNYLSPLDPPSANYQAVWIYGKSPTTPYLSPDSQHQVSRYLLLDPRATDANGVRGNDDWWFVIQRYWPSSYQPSNHGDWGLEVNFHNVAGDAGPANSGGVGWGFGTGVSSLVLDWLPGANAPQFGLEPNAPNENIPLPPVTRNAWHTYVVHYIAGRTDGSTARPGALTVWADGSDVPAINLSNVNTVQRAQGPDGNYYTQRWMQLWEGDYTRNLQSVSTVRLAQTRVGNTLAQALADRPVVIGTTAPGQYYSGHGTNAGAPSVAPATPLTAADGAIPASLGGGGANPPTPVVTTPTPPRPTPTTTTTTTTTTSTTDSRPSPRRPRRSLSDSALEGSPTAQTAISLWWDGIHFTRWGRLKSHLQSHGVEPSAFLQGHPAIVEMLSVTPVQWDSRQFYVRTSLAAWLDRRGANYGTWVRRHTGAAQRLAA